MPAALTAASTRCIRAASTFSVVRTGITCTAGTSPKKLGRV
jgi:hypothetical protein